MLAAFVPDYSGGPAPDFNGIPYLAPEGTTALLCESTCWCQEEMVNHPPLGEVTRKTYSIEW